MKINIDERMKMIVCIHMVFKRLSVVPPIPRWLSEEEDEEEIQGGENVNGTYGGMQEPPVTPVARDELALRRYRFFSELLDAAKGTNSHRVRFDPLGPLVHPG